MTSSSGIKGTLRYLAYELLASPDDYPIHTTASDVWAFGMVVYVSLSVKSYLKLSRLSSFDLTLSLCLHIGITYPQESVRRKTGASSLRSYIQTGDPHKADV